MHIYMIMNADCNLIYFVYIFICIYIYVYIRTVNVKCKEHIGCQVVSASQIRPRRYLWICQPRDLECLEGLGFR
jgi:hypothetical protein